MKISARLLLIIIFTGRDAEINDLLSHLATRLMIPMRMTACFMLTKLKLQNEII